MVLRFADKLYQMIFLKDRISLCQTAFLSYDARCSHSDVGSNW